MRSREQQWTEMHDAYCKGERMFLPRQLNKEFASVCLLLRDAEWAADLFPISSLGRLGITTSPVYKEWVGGRYVSLGVDEQDRLTITSYDGSNTVKSTRHVAEFDAQSLQEAAAWLHGIAHG
jgi:hypothetical protein